MREHQLFQIGQKALIFKKGRLLILEASDKRGFWDLPGGRIEKKEDKDLAFQREIAEELGISSFAVIGMVGYSLNYRTEASSLCIIGSAVDIGDSELRLSDEHSSLQWIAEDELPQFMFVYPAFQELAEMGFRYYRQKHA